MTSSPANVSRLRQRMIDDMRMRQLAPKTQDIYLHIVREFARFLGRSPATATVEDLRRYQLYLVDHGTSAVSLNHAITGLKFFFTITLDRPELMVRMQPVRVPRICAPLHRRLQRALRQGAAQRLQRAPAATCGREPRHHPDVP
ncbi:site-specific recombinase XerD [Paraburkholderia sp. WSM4179]|nr:site-specific recombinase XerD [Paraburkholderia sp. WSM4179]